MRTAHNAADDAQSRACRRKGTADEGGGAAQAHPGPARERRTASARRVLPAGTSGPRLIHVRYDPRHPRINRDHGTAGVRVSVNVGWLVRSPDVSQRVTDLTHG